MDAERVSPYSPAGVIGRVRAWLNDSHEQSVTQRAAGTIFVIRVLSAGIAYGAQVLLARWMGGADYGIYVYAWTWVLLLGSVMDFGISVSAQKFIPEYRGAGQDSLLRGFLRGSRWLTFVASCAVAILLVGIVWLARSALGESTAAALYIGCLTLPAFVVANTQDGIARSYDWMRLALMPQFIVRQTLIVGFAAGAFALGLKIDAIGAMVASLAAVWLAMAGQMLVLNRKLGVTVAPGPRAYDLRGWLTTSLPIMLIESFYLLLGYIDILMLQQYRPAEDVGVYFAAVKTLALVSFIHFAMSASTAHRFSEYHAAGDRERLSAYLASSIKWTFWPSLAATLALLALGKPLLWLFGPTFTEGYGLMFILAIGLMARAAIGPVEKLLNMIGQQKICAIVYAVAFAMNAALCLVLIPRFGGYGAAVATATSLVFETVLLFWVTKRRLGLHVLAWGRTSSNAPPPTDATPHA